MVTPVLPNNNHPQRFLKLDVKMLPVSNRMDQNVLEQRTNIKSSPTYPEDTLAFVDRYLEKHVTPGHLQSNIKTNPLYSMRDTADNKYTPSWTIKEYTTQTSHGQIADFLQDKEKTPKELDFWLEDPYTPGFDALLKKKEAEQRRKRLHKLLCVIGLSISVVIVVVIVPVVVLKN
ncbi:major intrinsically disordered NOTCH2-binding receptor 1-like [Corythoichthys intestinalis]|uniref:major intrinsically disordered NOTCH2-binding receptor 1-like n=1 Tax=Corythoichthys intestinalis TaxID=161448 RepID=UPI0025A66566|nr:major intrinsically disordered NOTCH2-binding receptor 1-like [Corythoichthys intestinalis]